MLNGVSEAQYQAVKLLIGDYIADLCLSWHVEVIGLNENWHKYAVMAHG